MGCKDCVVGALGTCSGDYCRAEREALIEWATDLAQGKGHQLGEFRKLKGEPVWEARCLRCGRSLSVALSPEPGQPDVSGEVTTEGCLPDDLPATDFQE